MLHVSCQVRSCKPGEAISIIETDCQVDFEAPKDYKEPSYTPAAASGPGSSTAQEGQSANGTASAAAAGSSGAAAAAAEAEEPEEPEFVPFVGAGRRLDGKPASSSSTPPAASAAAAAAAARAAAAAGSSSAAGGSGKSNAVTGGSKPGTFVSTGNRLADKLALDKVRRVGRNSQLPHAFGSRGLLQHSASSWLVRTPFGGAAYTRVVSAVAEKEQLHAAGR